MLQLLVIVSFVSLISGHGMMLEPPNRSSMWRFFPNSPKNYNDHQNFCGGFAVQWINNKGKCGLCGDDYRLEQPRPNENTGMYGQGKIARVYKSGDIIDVGVLLTVNHLGYFNFSICPIENRDLPEPGEECFQQLKLGDGTWSYEVSTKTSGRFETTVQLPEGLRCEQCTLRWWYKTGNSWGKCDDGTYDLGCGDQETFVSCADVSIV